MESGHPSSAVTTIPNPIDHTTTCNSCRWFAEEAAISNGNFDKEYSEDEDDLYNDMLATEILHHDSIPTNCQHPSPTNNTLIHNEKLNEALIDITTKGLGIIFSSYRDIIHECIQSVLNVSTLKEWQTLLIQLLVFSDHASTDRVMCIRQTSDGKSLPVQYTATMRRYVSIVVVPLISIGADQASTIYYTLNSDANIYAEHLDSICEPEDVQSMVKYLNGLTNQFFKDCGYSVHLAEYNHTSCLGFCRQKCNN